MHPLIWGILGTLIVGFAIFLIFAIHTWASNRLHGDELVKLGWIRKKKHDFPEPPSNMTGFEKLRTLAEAKKRVEKIIGKK